MTTCPRKRCTVFSNNPGIVNPMDRCVIVLEPSKTGYAAFSPDVPGCVATGKTVEQTLAEMRAAMVFHFEGTTEAGEPLPAPRGLEYYIRSGECVADAGVIC